MWRSLKGSRPPVWETLAYEVNSLAQTWSNFSYGNLFCRNRFWIVWGSVWLSSMSGIDWNSIRGCCVSNSNDGEVEDHESVSPRCDPVITLSGWGTDLGRDCLMSLWIIMEDNSSKNRYTSSSICLVWVILKSRPLRLSEKNLCVTNPSFSLKIGAGSQTDTANSGSSDVPFWIFTLFCVFVKFRICGKVTLILIHN